jgi:cation-transporting ATPase F
VLSGIAAMCAVQLFFTYAPVMNRLFHSAPMPLAAWADVLAVGLVAFWAVGAEKWISRRLRRWIRRRANTRGRREASRGDF